MVCNRCTYVLEQELTALGFEVLDIKLSSGTYGDSSELSDSSTVLVIYRDKTPFNDNLVSKKY